MSRSTHSNACAYLNSTTPPVYAVVKYKILLALAKAELVKEAKNELSMLKDMLGVNVLNGIVGCVDVGVAVLERGLKDERSWVPVPGS